MITISDKRNCCGCSACVQICPKQCIDFNEDNHGFRYPLVNENKCVDCGLCETVCPVLNQYNPKEPFKVYAGINSDKATRYNSSSGGVFSSLAKSIIENGGVVFGAGFDTDWEVEHVFIEAEKDLHILRGSKYLQSRIGNTYKKAQEFLNQGRSVLYSGTSCQIAGLKRFLRKEYDNLITVDVVCHGAPSPLVWRKYLGLLLHQHGYISKDIIKCIDFRDKVTGWKNYSITVEKSDGEVMFHEIHNRNQFMRLFLSNLSIRPSCFKCPAKQGKSHSDITLADYWGIDRIYPQADDDKGISLILVNSEKGIDFLRTLDIILFDTDYSDALAGNPCILKSVPENKYYSRFWRAFEKKGISVTDKFLRKSRPNLFVRVLHKMKNYF